MTEVYIETSDIDNGSLILTRAHQETENFLKERARLKTLKNISFIDSKLSQTIKSEHKASLINAI